MLERLDDHARGALLLAQEEARSLNSPELGDEHLLLGLLGLGKGVGARALITLGISLPALRGQIGPAHGRSDEAAVASLPLGAAARRTVERSVREALRLGHRHVGSEHLLLALVHEPDGAATRILAALGVGVDQIRTAVLANSDIGKPSSRIEVAPLRPVRGSALPRAGVGLVRLSGWRRLWYGRIVRLPPVFYPLAWFNCSVPLTRRRLDRLMNPREMLRPPRRRPD